MKLAVSQQLINTAHRMCSAGPPDRPPKPKGTEELQALQQRYNHSSSHLHTMSYGVSRPKMLKSRSQVRRWVSFSYWVEGFCDVCVCVCMHACVPEVSFTLLRGWFPSLSSPSLPSSLPPSRVTASIPTAKWRYLVPAMSGPQEYINMKKLNQSLSTPT